MTQTIFVAGATGAIGNASQFVFAPDLMLQMIALGDYPPEHVMRLVSYPLVHGNMTHALFVVVILLALGKMVGEVFRWWAVLVVFFGAAVAGAFAYMAVPGNAAPLFGGYPAVYGNRKVP